VGYYLGNTRASFVVENGQITKKSQADFDPWGVKHSNSISNPVLNRFEYQGKEKDATFGLNWINLGARRYNPTIGLLDAVDPMAILANSQSTNSYVNGNPLSFIDPTGMMADSTGGGTGRVPGMPPSEISPAPPPQATNNNNTFQPIPYLYQSIAGSGGGHPVIKQYKPDMADRWREGNILQQMAYGFADGIYSIATYSDHHLGGAQFENYDDKINTKLFWLMTLAGPISNIGKGTQVGKNLISNIRFPVYRVFGNVSKQSGFSWTFINPKLFTANFFRKIAGLPNGNSATSIVKGSAKVKDVKLLRQALPLDGNPGGLPELIIDPKNVRMKAPGDFKSYFKF
jgi:RHS repeat-associated protein